MKPPRPEPRLLLQVTYPRSSEVWHGQTKERKWWRTPQERVMAAAGRVESAEKVTAKWRQLSFEFVRAGALRAAVKRLKRRRIAGLVFQVVRVKAEGSTR